MNRRDIEKFRDALLAARKEALLEFDGLGPFSREHVNRALAEVDLAVSSLELAAMLLGRGE